MHPLDQTHQSQPVLPEDKVAPDEDTDMDLIADKLVLLSLPVTESKFRGWTTIPFPSPVTLPIVLERPLLGGFPKDMPCAA